MPVKQLTYEELGKQCNMTPNKAHLEVKRVYNKMVKKLLLEHNINIWDCVVALKDFFGMSEREAVEKLNKEFKALLKKDAIQRYGNCKF
jgi:hypothetical protein